MKYLFLIVCVAVINGCKKEEPVDNLPPLLDPCICCADPCNGEDLQELS